MGGVAHWDMGLAGRGEGEGAETYVLSDISPMPISKLQGIAFRVNQAPPARSGGSVRQVEGAPPSCPPIPPHPPPQPG